MFLAESSPDAVVMTTLPVLAFRGAVRASATSGRDQRAETPRRRRGRTSAGQWDL